VQNGQNAIFAAHIVRVPGHGAQGRAAQHIFVASVIQQIGEIGGTPTELPHRQRLIGPWQPVAQKFGHFALIEAFILANFYDIVVRRIRDHATLS
jgi:hypothetical protein